MATSNDLNIEDSGFVVFDGVFNFTGRTLTAGAGITISNGSGVAGNPVISSLNPTNPASTCNFLAYRNVEILNFGGGAGVTICPFEATTFNVGGNYDTGTFLFTAPNNGLYTFHMAIGWGKANTGSTEYTTFFRYSGAVDSYIGNNFNPSTFYAITAPIYTFNSNQSMTIQMIAGSTMHCEFVYNLGSNTATLIGSAGGDQFRTYFSGYQVA